MKKVGAKEIMIITEMMAIIMIARMTEATMTTVVDTTMTMITEDIIRAQHC